ncbi:uncharacterized protein LOC114747641 [Neltuma alba]|uniref:uncharacterized protein LOC114723066 n=1 Tax=Neltuma alba TaxID=207710 RepID=UPI0010A524F6|nr:uncharacterized protein LOC114723066 [Prosopis alba]XP_028791823.1 uncharacterized protein LOC114747641 [Prosopis alba]
MLNSRDYHSHISQVHRTPSVLPDVPRYPNAYAALNKEVVYEDEGPRYHHHHHQNPEERERVEVVEYERADNYGNTEVVYEESDRYEADRYGNPRGNKLYRWKTYRD